MASLVHNNNRKNIFHYLSSFTQLLPNNLPQGWLKKLKKKQAQNCQSPLKLPNSSKMESQKIYLVWLEELINNILCPWIIWGWTSIWRNHRQIRMCSDSRIARRSTLPFLLPPLRPGGSSQQPPCENNCNSKTSNCPKRAYILIPSIVLPKSLEQTCSKQMPKQHFDHL